jgi:hypothetical protein
VVFHRRPLNGDEKMFTSVIFAPLAEPRNAGQAGGDKTHHITYLPAQHSLGHQPTNGLKYELKRTILNAEE